MSFPDVSTPYKSCKTFTGNCTLVPPDDSLTYNIKIHSSGTIYPRHRRFEENFKTKRNVRPASVPGQCGTPHESET